MKKYTFRVNGYLMTVQEISYFAAKERIRIEIGDETAHMELISIRKVPSKKRV